MDANIEELKLQVANLMARVSMAEAQIAEMDDDIPESSQNVFSGDESLPQAYSSYFKVYDASTEEDGCQIGVVDGYSYPNTYCGSAIVNGTRIDVLRSLTHISAAGSYKVWLHAWLDSEKGYHAEIIVSDPNDNDPPDNPNNGILYNSIILGRFEAYQDGESSWYIDPPQQDYLAGSDIVIDLCGLCVDE